jgi:hypothetical protein
MTDRTPDAREALAELVAALDSKDLERAHVAIGGARVALAAPAQQPEGSTVASINPPPLPKLPVGPIIYQMPLDKLWDWACLTGWRAAQQPVALTEGQSPAVSKAIERFHAVLAARAHPAALSDAQPAQQAVAPETVPIEEYRRVVARCIELGEKIAAAPAHPSAQAISPEIMRLARPIDPSDYYGPVDAVARAIEWMEMDDDNDSPKVRRRLKMALTDIALSTHPQADQQAVQVVAEKQLLQYLNDAIGIESIVEVVERDGARGRVVCELVEGYTPFIGDRLVLAAPEAAAEGKA